MPRKLGDQLRVGDIQNWRIAAAIDAIGAVDGWTYIAPDKNTGLSQWSYSSYNTVNVPGDATTEYAIGDKVRFKQDEGAGTGAQWRYFYVIGTTTSTLTLLSGTNLAVGNVPITDLSISKWPNPINFPGSFLWNPAIVGFPLLSYPVGFYRFTVTGRIVQVSVRMQTAGVSNSTSFTISAPIVSANVASGAHYWGAQLWAADDNGAAIQNGRAYIPANSSTIIIEPNLSGGAWTAANGKRADFCLWYEI